MLVIIIVIVKGGRDMIGIKKDGRNNKSVGIIKDLNKLINWVMDCEDCKYMFLENEDVIKKKKNSEV